MAVILYIQGQSSERERKIFSRHECTMSLSSWLYGASSLIEGSTRANPCYEFTFCP